jgi:hypothetical protein
MLRFALAAVLVVPVAVAADIDPPTYATAFSPQRFAEPRADGLWAAGTISDGGALVRYDASGSIAAVRRFDFASAYTLRPLDDGALLTAGCSATRVDARGDVVWRNDAGWTVCPQAGVLDAAGNVWTHGRCDDPICADLPDGLARLDPRGVLRTRVDAAPLGGIATIAPVASGAGVYVASADAATLARVDAGGARTFVASVEGLPDGTRFRRIVTDADGNAVAFGLSPDAQLSVASLTSAGARRYARALPTVATPRIVDAAADATGSVVLVATVTESVSLFGTPLTIHDDLTAYRFGADGAPLWQRAYANDAACGGCGVRFAGGGDVLVAATIALPDDSVGRVERIGTDGAVRATIDVPHALVAVARERDGSLLVAARRERAVGPDGTGDNVLRRFASDGSAVAAPGTAVAALPRLAASAFGRDGTSVVVSTEVQTPRSAVALHAPDGTRRWQREAAVFLGRYARAATNARRSCWAGLRTPSRGRAADELFVECLDGATGARIYDVVLAREAPEDAFELVLLDDDSVVVGHSSRGFGARHVRVTPTGVAIVTTLHDVLLRDLETRELAVVDAEGAVQSRADVTTRVYGSTYALAESRRVAYVSDERALTVPIQFVAVLAANGVPAWRERVIGEQYALAFLDDDVVALAATFFGARRVTRFAAADGAARWLHEDRGTATFAPRLAADAAAARVAFVGGDSAALAHATVLDAADGGIVHDAVAPCVNLGCRIAAVAVDAGGTARYVEQGVFTAEAGGPAFRVRVLDRAVRSPVRLDTPDVAGAWYPRYADGQGVFLDWLAASRTLFGAWFTYDAPGQSDDPTAQHWFALQGSLAGATGGTVTLPILRTLGGGFERRPTRNTFAVGEATLTIVACDRATLAYRFADSQAAGPFAGHSGERALRRLGGCAP